MLSHRVGSSFVILLSLFSSKISTKSIVFRYYGCCPMVITETKGVFTVITETVGVVRW